KNLLFDALDISGQAGLYGELYSMSGKEGRRKPSTGRIFFRPTITLFENFNIAFDIFLSTEGSYTKQQINRISLHPSWDWGKAHVGDFSHRFSEYTLNGVTITGGGLEIYYDLVRFEAVGGRIQRKINAGLSNSAYARYLGGVKIGVGKTSESFLDLNILKIKDDVYSLPGSKFNYTEENSSATSVYRVTPQENLIVGFNGNIDILDMLTLFGEISGSAYSRDIRSEIIEAEEIPNFVNDIFTIRHSTFADFSYNAGMDFKYDKYNAKVEYSVINPGYISLGRTTNLNDRKTISISGGVRLLKNKLSLRANYRVVNNNLLSQKQHTLTRTNTGFSARFAPTNEISVAFKTSFNIMKNDATISERKINNVSSLYTLNGVWRTKLINLNHTFTASYSFNQSKDHNILRRGNDSYTNNYVIGVSTQLRKNWTISPRVSISSVNLKNILYRTTSTYSIMVSNKMLNSKLINSVGLNYMNSKIVKSPSFTIQSAYSITRSDIIKANIRSSFYWGKVSSYRNFNEHRGSITYTHKF
ncbi:MAG: hypothetical protein R3250_03780, partial [Melioribacteraceae bacterium]|nr:hypothetical protein [Melioribacteraceae bacterium]